MAVPTFLALRTDKKGLQILLPLLSGWHLCAKLHQNDSYEDAEEHTSAEPQSADGFQNVG